jgi:hypothetical protein
MIKKTGSKTKNAVELPTYKVEEKDPTYHMKRGKVLEAHSNLHDNKDGKRTITSKVKIWNGLTPKDKASLKKSIMIALEHKFKGGSISDFPSDTRDVVKEVYKFFGGKGFYNEEQQKKHEENLRRYGKTAEEIYNSPRSIAIRQKAQGQGLFENYFKPKGSRQLIYFSDSSSDEEEPHLPVKRGRGRPKKC